MKTMRTLFAKHIGLIGLAFALSTPVVAQDVDCNLSFTVNSGCAEDGTGWGSVTNIHNGISPITIQWSTGAGNQFIVGLADGEYSVTVADASGCSLTQFITILCDKKGDDPGDKDDEPNCQFRTQTMGGWGAPPSGDNPAAFLHANFAAAFPSGITIGCGSRTLSLTSALAVQAFLPSGSTARMLNTGHMVNPGQTYKNVLAGQLMAATISLRFDELFDTFGESDGYLGDLVYAGGLFEGWTVSAVIAEANSFIGGCGSSFTASQLNAALTVLNENYVDGTMDNGNFICEDKKDDDKKAMLLTPGFQAMDMFPNPATDIVNIDLAAQQDGRVLVSVLDMSGRVVIPASAFEMVAGETRRNTINVGNLPAGAYMVTMQRNGHSAVQRIMVAR